MDVYDTIMKQRRSILAGLESLGMQRNQNIEEFYSGKKYVSKVLEIIVQKVVCLQRI